MAAPKWHEGPMVAFDTETTGIDVFNDRIITAAAVFHRPGQRPVTMQWLLNPGIDIPAEAAAVHGWTTEHLNTRVPAGQALAIGDGQQRPMPLDAALFEITAKVGFAIGQEYPLVGANLAYDLSLLEAENARHGVDTLASRPVGITGVVDVQVLEKQFDQFRKQCYRAPGCDPKAKHHECGGCRGGKYKCGGCGSTDRTLTSLCNHYGIRHTGAHDASGDALATIRLAHKLAGLWPEIGRWKLSTLHDKQIEWRRDHQLGLADFFRKQGDHEAAAGVCPEWPLHQRCAGAKAVA